MKRAFARRLLAVGFFAVLGLLVASASAHPTPISVAFVDFTVDGARIEHDVPVEELQRALHRDLLRPGDSAEAMVTRERASLLEYGGRHLALWSAKGDWTVEPTEVTGHASEDGPRVTFHFTARPPAGNEPEPVTVHDEIVAHEVISHYSQIYVRSDWAAGRGGGEPALAGVVHAGRFDVAVPRTGSFVCGLRSVIESGARHIATGTDHVLFVFALLLAAPMVARGGRWAEHRSARDAAVTIAKLVSAFTIGHSITLVLGAVGWVRLPPSIVEPVVALSILAAAIHAMIPMFPRREPVVAAGFGLVHGLAFASGLPRHDVGPAQLAWSLFGFDLGIELAQLALVALVVPWVLILARTGAFAAFRAVAASVVGLLALGWLIERVTCVANPIGPVVAWLETHGLLCLVALASVAVVARATPALRDRPTPPASGARLPMVGAHRRPARATSGP